MLMKEYANVDPTVISNYVSITFFVGMIFLVQVIMLNLFVLVVLQQYDEYHQKEENPIERFEDMIENFKKSWNRFTTEHDKGERISTIKITEFLMELEGDLAIDMEDEDWLKKYNSSEAKKKAIKERLKREIVELKFIT